jgi:hypothetical protein
MLGRELSVRETAEKRAAKKMGPMPVARELMPCSNARGRGNNPSIMSPPASCDTCMHKSSEKESASVFNHTADTIPG